MKNSPWKFVFLIGTLSLLSDLTYEGGRSLAGPFLTWLGASPFAIATIAGGGEFVGYALRLLSGRLADKTKKYWPIAFGGYALNLLSVPALAFCGRWETAAALLVAERAGKGTRNPSRDTMLSFAAEATGDPGSAFGVHDAMDKIGAVIGPLCIALIFFATKRYDISFGSLVVPVLAAFTVLGLAAIRYPDPQNSLKNIQAESPDAVPLEKTRSYSPHFWRGITAAGLLAAGTADFPFIAQHLMKHSGISGGVIPVLYAVAMLSGALASFSFSRIFKRIGIAALSLPAVIGAAAVSLVFLGNDPAAAIAGSVLWGAGFASQEPIMKTFITKLVPRANRATAFGVFWATYGLSWFAGSALLGAIYGRSVSTMVTASIAIQVAALPFIFWANENKNW